MFQDFRSNFRFVGFVVRPHVREANCGQAQCIPEPFLHVFVIRPQKKHSVTA